MPPLMGRVNGIRKGQEGSEQVFSCSESGQNTLPYCAYASNPVYMVPLMAVQCLMMMLGIYL